MLEDFDLSGFWEDSDYARKSYVGKAVTPELVAEVEAELGSSCRQPTSNSCGPRTAAHR